MNTASTMSFNVYAGNMFCGVLDIIIDTHIFHSTNGKVQVGTYINKYKHLRLVRK